jgi:hypothetical protein
MEGKQPCQVKNVQIRGTHTAPKGHVAVCSHSTFLSLKTCASSIKPCQPNLHSNHISVVFHPASPIFRSLKSSASSFPPYRRHFLSLKTCASRERERVTSSVLPCQPKFLVQSCAISIPPCQPKFQYQTQASSIPPCQPIPVSPLQSCVTSVPPCQPNFHNKHGPAVFHPAIPASHCSLANLGSTYS